MAWSSEILVEWFAFHKNFNFPFGNYPKKFQYHLPPFQMVQNFSLNGKRPICFFFFVCFVFFFYFNNFCSFYFSPKKKMFLLNGVLNLHVSYLSLLDYFTFSVGRR